MPPREPSPKTPYPTGLKLLLAVAVFVPLFLLLDLTVGHMDCRRKLREIAAHQQAQTGAASDASSVIQSDLLHHTLRPGVDNMETWGEREYRLRTDSLGFKSPVVREVPLTNAAWRILILGDSFAQGVGVEAHETFAGRLQVALDPSQERVEVLNGGVISASPRLYLLKAVACWENRGLRFDEVWTFIDTSDVMDELIYGDFEPAGLARDVPLHRSGRFEPVPNDPSFFERSLTYRTLKRLVFDRDPWNRRLYRDPESGMVLDYYDRGAPWALRDDLYRSWGVRGLESAAFHMRALTAFLTQRGVVSGIAVFPWPEEIRRRNEDSLNLAFWSGFAETNHIPLLNLYARFLEGDPEQTIRRNFIEGDVHWNAEGHALVAESWLRLRRDLPGFPALAVERDAD